MAKPLLHSNVAAALIVRVQKLGNAERKRGY